MPPLLSRPMALNCCVAPVCRLTLAGVTSTATRVGAVTLMVMLLVYAVLSWVQPGSPAMGMLDRLCSPVLKPVRRLLPPIGGVDLSVLVLIVLLQVGLILLG